MCESIEYRIPTSAAWERSGIMAKVVEQKIRLQ